MIPVEGCQRTGLPRTAVGEGAAGLEEHPERVAEEEQVHQKQHADRPVEETQQLIIAFRRGGNEGVISRIRAHAYAYVDI